MASNNPLTTTLPTDAQTLQTYLDSLAAVVEAAQTALQDPSISRDQAAAEREALNYAQALLLLASEDALPSATPTQIIFGPDDDVFAIAQKALGSALRYKDILSLNGFVNTDIPVGTILTLPRKSF